MHGNMNVKFIICLLLLYIAPQTRLSLLHILKARYIRNQRKDCRRYHPRVGLILGLFYEILTEGGVSCLVENGVNVR